MVKSLSQSTLEKRFAELGLSDKKVSVLNDFFLCCCNLYGVISVKDARSVFEFYNGASFVSEKQFSDFADLIARKSVLPYSFYTHKEIFPKDKSDLSECKYIVNNQLILGNPLRFSLLKNVLDKQGDKTFYTPERERFDRFIYDPFFSSIEGNKMKKFISRLKTTGTTIELLGERGTILNLDGDPVTGKMLSEFYMHTLPEKAEIVLSKTEAKRKKAEERFHTTAAEKVLNRIRLYILAGSAFPNDTLSKELYYTLKFMLTQLGVSLTHVQTDRFIDMFIELNNNSNVWLNRGHSPREMFSAVSDKTAKSIYSSPLIAEVVKSGCYGIANTENGLSSGSGNAFDK